jgi:proline iminopeptidase
MLDILVFVITLGLLGFYALVVRPRMIRWGATDEEVAGLFPGADLIPGGVRSGTMAITIEAPPADVWAWLVQMGYDRAGWYSWDRLDNWGRSSSERIHPEWQKLSIGDHLSAMPDNSMGWEVAALEPQRFLGLRASVDKQCRPFDPKGTRPSSYSDSLWAFQLKELPGNRTRLVVSGYWAVQPPWLRPIVNIFLEPAHWIMQVRQFANLKRRAERDRVEMKRAA